MVTESRITKTIKSFLSFFTLLVVITIGPSFHLLSQAPGSSPGSPEEPVRVICDGIDMDVHSGRLRPAIGTENIQVVRVNRSQPQMADNFGWTYSHAPMLAYWNGTFYLQYLSNPFGEHFAPGHTMVTTSKDGRNWEFPREIFPIYHLRPGPVSSHRYGLAMMHQRMGFYVSPKGRLLILGFYGLAPSPWGENGIGRVVRECYRDGSFGPIYFVKYNSLSSFDETNTKYPFFTSSTDPGFIEACRSLLADKLFTMQWWEEDRGNEDHFYRVTGHEAPSVYHRRDGKAVVHWKRSWAAISSDEGKTWSEPVRLPTIVTDGAKTWGQQTADGRYALVYNPAPHGSHRWPLAVVTGDDGILFKNMALIHGEVPPRRFAGRAKDFGPQYVRGISEGNGTPFGSEMWVTYSVNKEDIWISRIPVPIEMKLDGPVNDDFESIEPGGVIDNWNLYRTCWATAEISDFPAPGNRCILLQDRDPYDYAKVVRVFEESHDQMNISFRLYARQVQNGQLDIEIVDRFGYRPIRIRLESNGGLLVNDGTGTVTAGGCGANIWNNIAVQIDIPSQTFNLSLNGSRILQKARFAEECESLERIEFRTGPYRNEPTRSRDRYEDGDLTDPDPDNSCPPAIYALDDLVIN